MLLLGTAGFVYGATNAAIARFNDNTDTLVNRLAAGFLGGLCPGAFGTDYIL